MFEGTKPPIPPLILGIVTARMLAERRYPESVWTCGGAELRADGLPPGEVITAVRDFAAERKHRGFSGRVVFTLRLQRDGGAWENSRAREREPLWVELAEQAEQSDGSDAFCDFVDVEVEEVASLSGEIRSELLQGKLKTILSHHSFVPEGPDIWESWFATMRSFHPAAVKFAVTLENSGEAASLLRFARKVGREFPMSCVIAMGEAGRATRMLSPLLGCPVTYAFLEGGAVAPGQLSLEVLRACCNYSMGRPEFDAPEADWMEWAEQVIPTVQESTLAG